MKKTTKITVRGIVQGVGFRPFIHKLAVSNNISGKVSNRTGSVLIDARGTEENLKKFISGIDSNKPPAAVISEKKVSLIRSNKKYKGFKIEKSGISGEIKSVTPDLGICAKCAAELFDKKNRRYMYPFINCTDCGPRFTIVKDTPYDRKNTTMNDFVMCKSCFSEYINIKNRRYHAEPNACPVCGPSAFLKGDDIPLTEGHEALQKAKKLLKQGGILAVKGLGGFHLACSAADAKAVEVLRQRKKRDLKPFAVMTDTFEKLSAFAIAGEYEKTFLKSPAAPVVLLRKKHPFLLAEGICGGLAHIGVCMAYTPLHMLLFDPEMTALVMTSANLSDEPLQYKNDGAFAALSGIADYILFHNREINIRADDSVIKPCRNFPVFIRRSRGYVPAPVFLDKNSKYGVIGTGGLLKNTLCFVKNDRAIMSQHIGDLENAAAFDYFTSTIDDFTKFYSIKPRAVVSDKHPDYLSTRYAAEYCAENRISHFKIQHHYAHFLSVMAENKKREKTIGIIFDGTGLGDDGNTWGGEFLVGDYNGFERAGMLKYRKVPGGDAAAREGIRSGISFLSEFLSDEEVVKFYSGEGVKSSAVAKVLEMKQKSLNSPLTSGAGRLFDAAASILGLCHISGYDSQAPMELEAAAHENSEKKLEPLTYIISREDNMLTADIMPAISSIYSLRNKKRASYWSAVFHLTFAFMAMDMAKRISRKYGIKDVALSGGVFQNTYLLERLIYLLKNEGFNVLIHNRLSPNDSSIALGQAVYGAERLRNARR